MLSPCCLLDTLRMITASALALSLTVGLLCECAGKMYILKAYYYCFAFLNPFILEKNPTDTDIKTIYLIGNTISIYFLVK